MKAQSTVRKHLRRLRKFIETSDDKIATRVAWEVEQAIRWAREDVVSWPAPIDSVKDTANLIRKEL